MSITIDGDLGISGVDGTAASPAIRGNDSNTGISYGTDIVTINTGGVARVTTDASGNVGVGTTPLTRLHTFVENAGTPTTSGSATTGVSARFQNSSINMDFGTYGDGTCFIQPRLIGNNTSNFSLALNPNGGNVGIGTQSPGAKLHTVSAVGQNSGLFTDNTNYTLDIKSGGSQVAYIGGATGSALALAANGAERARIDSSGNLLVGATSAFTSTYTGANAVQISGKINNDQGYIAVQTTQTAARDLIQFINPNGVVGRISTSGSSTAYNTSSDYRLKENVSPMTGALDKVAALKPCTYNWKADGSAGQGFIAHELQAVVPDCVTGEKDAVRTVDELDADGKKIGTKEEPQYQGVDTSFLVATLVAAIQEQQATIAAMETRLAALEA